MNPTNIKKLGTIDCDIVETTPIVFNGRLHRFEYIRYPRYKPNKTGDSYFRLVDVESGEVTPSFAAGYHLGSAYVEGETVYVYGVKDWGAPDMQVFWSNDLASWESKLAFATPGWGIYNNSVCKGPDGYVMPFELGEPEEIVGVRFTMRFARSNNLLDWEILPEDTVFSKDRYTACPAIRFLDGKYYMIYLEEKQPGPTYEPHIVRSPDLINWEPSPYSPLLTHSDEDKRIANPALTPEQREHIAKSKNINNSDVDLCEYKDETVIYYSWGDQEGVEFLAEARYEGSLDDFLRSYYP